MSITSYIYLIQCIGYDYTAYVDYMDLAVRCPFTHSYIYFLL